MGVPSIDMHSKDARLNGETEQRLYALSAWRETSFFTNRERAALAWTEALTLITEGRAPDEVYAEVRKTLAKKIWSTSHGDHHDRRLESTCDR
jgi:alkylhydroperoxidase family enzyme